MTDPNRKLRTGDKAPWPKGKRRNNPRVPKGYRDLRHFLDDTMDFTDEDITKTALAKHLGVRRGTLNEWLHGGCNPPQVAVDRIFKLMRKVRQ